MTSDPDTVTITAHCLCKAHNFTTSVPKSKLPLPAYACHCNSCRHVTGALYLIDSEWPEPRKNVDTSGLRKYAFSSRIKVLFCGTCSTPLFIEDTAEPHHLGAFTGALKNNQGDLVKLVHHIFVGDTLDGDAQEYNWDWPPASSLKGLSGKAEYDSVQVRCKCGGVDLVMHRGNYEGKEREELPWFIDPTTHRPIASFDACDSCRLQSGIDIFHWTFAELKNLSYSSNLAAEGKVFPKNTTDLRAAVDAQDPLMGTLTYYASSPDVQRYFCKNCSACVFYAVDSRPDIVDVALGLLDAPDGARAEGFVLWLFGKLVWVEDTKGGWREDLMKRIEKESEHWRIERGYPKSWKRIEREEAEAKGKS
ncbi:hypothetical protein K469DRAFT_671473 [Zopfia rhizophila CBS 207.26]|uniref:CENP-V/GFA domain-containing protein n=1 Tax=Zopfia rhizophila CBS 207.26 TaxID=1314779 RepID=A0A6A6DP27_9PEZI|nr:hypothetical protein K469DRAFT_671473 [Zopfia rhizophila CBS 207.26]